MTRTDHMLNCLHILIASLLGSIVMAWRQMPYKPQQARIRWRSKLSMSSSSASVAATCSHWTSAASSNIDFATAMDDIVRSVDGKAQESPLAIFFVSSTYESMKDQKDFDLAQIVRKKLPNVQNIIGITTNCPIGCLNGEASEVENRPGVAFMFAPSSAGVDLAVNHVTTDDLSSIRLQGSQSEYKSSGDGFAWVFSTDVEKNKLAPYIHRIRTEEQVEVLGVTASVVSGQRGGAVYLIGPAPATPSKLLGGAVTAVMKGNISAFVMPSCSTRSVTAAWEVAEKQGRSIAGLRELEGADPAKIKFPLEALDNVLSASPPILSMEDLDSLRRDLLVSVGGFGQRPTDLDPPKGSFALATLSPLSAPLQFKFGVRDEFLARQSLTKLTYSLQNLDSALDVRGVVSLGAGDRGVKMFRIRNFETSCIADEIKPHSGKLGGMHGGTIFFTDGLVVGNNEPKGEIMISDTDHALVFLASRASDALSKKLRSFSPFQIPSAASPYLSHLDQLTPQEREKYCDAQMGPGVVLKKDPTASAPVKVGDMDFIVPDKLPMPNSYLESMVWDRDKDVDRGRERYPAARALVMAKKREVNAPVRSLTASIKDLRGTGKLPLAFIELMRSGIHYSPLSVSSTPESIISMAKQIQGMTMNGNLGSSGLKLGGLGCNVDGSNFLGSFADADSMRTLDLPSAPSTLFCSDFVLYAYQLFRARAEGADWVKLHSVFNTNTELSYLAKTARTMKMESVVVVYSASQALSVLNSVLEVQGICVSSKNINLWKVDAGKAEMILANVEVQEALKRRKEKQPEFVVFQEAFSDPDEIFRAADNGVDAIILGEELLHDRNSDDITEVLKRWVR